MPQRLAADDFSSLFEFLPIGAYRSTPDGRPLRANPALQRLNGFATEAEQLAAAGHDLNEWYVDPQRRQQFLDTLAREDCVVGFESEARRHADGVRIWVRENAHMVRDPQGQPLYYEGTIEEITDRVLARQALRESQAQLQQIIELIPGMVYRAELLADGRRVATYVSDGARELLGVEPADVMRDASVIHSLRHPEDACALETQIAHANAMRLPLSAEYRCVLPNGEMKWMRVASTPAPAAEGVSARVGVILDITAAKQAESLRLERDRAAAADLAKSAFLSRVSHELRTPLNAVLGFAQLLAADPELHNERQRGWTRQVLRSGRHLMALMDDILDLSSAQTGLLRCARAPVPLAPVLDEACDLLSFAAAEAAVSVQVLAQPAELPAALGDRKRVLQVLCNLLSNAIKYNRPGGWVRLGIEIEAAARLPSSAPAVVLTVADNGPGLNAHQIARLFQPFERLGAHNGSVPGTGLGLALSRQLAEAMGGEVLVDSRPGQGAVFRLRLPAAG